MVKGMVHAPLSRGHPLCEAAAAAQTSPPKHLHGMQVMLNALFETPAVLPINYQQVLKS